MRFNDNNDIEIDPDLAAYHAERCVLQTRIETARTDLEWAGVAVRECSSPGNVRRLAAASREVRTAVDALAAHDEEAENACAFAALLAA